MQTMKVRKKNAKEVKMDSNELDDKLRSMVDALEQFYGEYHDWECRYSRIGQSYYEKLEDSFEQLKFARDNATKSKVGCGPNTDWSEVSSPYRYSNDD
jgi:hypothetical protein